MAAVQRRFTLQKRFSVTGGASIDPASCAVSLLFPVIVEPSELLARITGTCNINLMCMSRLYVQTKRKCCISLAELYLNYILVYSFLCVCVSPRN